MKVIELKDGQTVSDALAEAGAPDAVIGLVSAIMGEDQPLCDCPPGVCLGESEIHNGSTADLFDEFAQDDDEEVTVEFEPDFDLSDEPAVSVYDKVEAVAQLGRIIETFTGIAEVQARLVQDLVQA
jgi:hypothetical protein